MQNKRVVITGIGAVTPVGLDMPSTWNALINGTSGVGPITRFDSGFLPVHVGAEVKNFDPTKSVDPKEIRRTDLFEQYALTAAHEALRNANLTITPEIAEETGVVIGSSIGGLQSLLQQYDLLREQGPRRLNPFCIPMVMSNGAAGMVTIDIGAKGPSYSPTSACATSNDALGQAAELIRRGAATVVLGGGSDATVSVIGIAGFDRLGALSHDNELPSKSPKPFDKNRLGVVIGEGACVMVLEELEFALARGANILAELVGYGQTSDAYHVIAPAEGGAGAARAIKLALRQAELAPEAVHYINAHGTATPLNDIAETQAIKAVFGDYAYKLPISSTKSMTGHMMGATGALEAAVCIHAIQHGIIPPTMNLVEPDPLCDLDYVPGEARKERVDVAMNNSFGFGGHNAVVVFKRFDGK
ncbi:MAG TPA: beta-ketoacyl-ACP synthase II [Anaerolineae bacterium]|jgi:beta-ketoacyl-acyl-carrier-protein synthase II